MTARTDGKTSGRPEMPPQPVGIIDSGIGGLPYLSRAREMLPAERFVYLADRANFPYGVRSREEVRDIVVGAVSRLVEFARPKLVVIACNTASVVSLAELRDSFSIPFVGVVPAIKPAGMAAPGGRIAVLATERTVEDPYVADLARSFASGNSIIPVAAGSLVDFIESDFALASRDEIRTAIQPVADQIQSERSDVVVLACTHFVHIRESLGLILGPDTPILDSVEGVTRQVVRVCQDANLTLKADVGSAESRIADSLVVTGGAHPDNYRVLAGRYRLQLTADGHT